MNKSIFLSITFLMIISIGNLFGQDEDDKLALEFDKMLSPGSPAANLLGVTESEIQKPSEPAKIISSFYNASNNFSAVPTSYALDIAPLWLFSSKSISWKEYTSQNVPLNNITQTLTLSFAIKSDTTDVGDLSSLGMATGFKISIYRGKIDESSKETIQTIFDDQLVILNQVNAIDFTGDSIFGTLLDAQDLLMNFELDIDDELQSEEFKEAKKQSDKRLQDLRDNEFSNAIEYLKDIKDSIQYDPITRTGFKLDLAGGFVFDFPENDLSYSELFKAGIWLTPGYEFKKGVSFYGIVRYLYNPELEYDVKDEDSSQFKKSNTGDIGLRLLYEPPKSNVKISGEAIYRYTAPKSITNEITANKTYRLVLNTEYQLKKDLSINLSIGRNFDGTINKVGNIFTAISFLGAIGQEYKMKT